jgi:hypothetical protein
MNVIIICQYCGFNEEKTVYNQNTLVNAKCSKCGDKNVELKDLDKTKIDTYSGSPAFKEPEKEEMVNPDGDVGWP